MDYAAAMHAQEENLKSDAPMEFVIWTQTEGMEVTADNPGTAEECAVLPLCGRSDLLFPGYAVLDTQMQDVCLISSALSAKLFGGKDTKGLVTEASGRQMEILDVIESEEIFLVLEASEQEDCSFDRAAVRCTSEEMAKTAEAFRKLTGEWKQLDYRIPVWIAQAACLTVPFMLWIYLLYLIKKTEKTSLLWYLLLAGGLILLVLQIQIPPDMIPAKWSDFDFWREYWENLCTSWKILYRSEKKIPDLPLMTGFIKTLKWTAIAAGGTLFGMRQFGTGYF